MHARYVLLAGLTAIVACSGSGGSSTTTAPTIPTTLGTIPAGVAFASTDLRVGSGAAAASGQTVAVDYVGWLYDAAAVENKGAVFDSSLGSLPFSFVLGAGQVIAGWDRGVAGMRVGGARRLLIPPELAYGAQGIAGVIPPNAPLVFEIALLAVQ